MAEFLGIGLSHYPGLFMLNEDVPVILRNTLAHGAVPQELRDPANWPDLMRSEWADDGGAGAAHSHRDRCFEALRVIRGALDDFQPDFVLMWGDDQYENFIEDIVPPFCAYILNEIQSRPFANDAHKEFAGNIWGDPADRLFEHRGHPEAARFLVNQLTAANINIPYSYRLRYSRGLSHAFINTLMFLDCDRDKGFPYPIVPFHVNCYGGELIRRRGGFDAWGFGEPDPPSPSVRSCFDLGRAIARILARTEYRVALIATSSWSHAFLTAKTHGIFPDHASDRDRLAELKEGRFAAWGDLTRETLEDAGQHEFLNWVCLAGAMTEAGGRPHIVDYVETYVMNSNKCFVLFPPGNFPTAIARPA